MGKIIDEYMDIKLQQEYVSKTIDTLWKMAQKYQKIKQILKDIPYGGDATVRRIQEVVEDGNDI